MFADSRRNSPTGPRSTFLPNAVPSGYPDWARYLKTGLRTGMLVDDRLRSLEEALADLLAKDEENPSHELRRMIRQLELEIAERKGIRGE